MPGTFILNDETKYNSYGFRVVTSGIELQRFIDNPVMLDGHNNSNQAVLGKWNNIRVEDGKLMADSEFDDGDDNAKAVKGKVERGYIKGSSMGLLFDIDNMVVEANRMLSLIKSEVIEASIIPVPSNAGALRLYIKKDGKLHLMDENEIKLCLNTVNNSTFNTKDNHMKKVFLSAAALVALGLEKVNQSDGIDENIVSDAINKLKQESDAMQLKLTAAEAALKKYKDAEDAKLSAEVDAFLKEVIPSKYDETERESITKLAKSDLAFAKKMADLVPAKQSLGGQVKNPEAPKAGEVKTMEEFQKLTVEQQLAFKKENPEQYNKIVASV